MTSTQSYYIYTQHIKLSAAAFTFYHVIVHFWPHTKTLTYIIQSGLFTGTDDGSNGHISSSNYSSM